MAEEESNQKDVFAHFGLASYHAQCFEMELGNILLIHRRLTNKTITLEELERFEESNLRKTLGAILNDVRKIVIFGDTTTPDVLMRALSKRNYLAHNFFRKHAASILSHSGREKMIAELEKMSNAFITADVIAQSVSMAAGKVLGITDELVNRELEKFRTENTKITPQYTKK